jgi:hypothetical protein
MADKTSKKSAKIAKRAAAKRVAANPTLLAGDNHSRRLGEDASRIGNPLP